MATWATLIGAAITGLAALIAGILSRRTGRDAGKVKEVQVVFSAYEMLVKQLQAQVQAAHLELDQLRATLVALRQENSQLRDQMEALKRGVQDKKGTE